MKLGPVVYIKQEDSLWKITYRTKRIGDLSPCTGLRYTHFESMITAFNYVLSVWGDARIRIRE